MTVMFDYEVYANDHFMFTESLEPPGPRWLRSLIGDELFRDVALVDFDPANIPTPPGDEVLAAMAHFPKLECIQLPYASITDEGLRHIRGLSRLKELVIREAPIGDRGLKYLSGLTNLEQLYLDETSISDAGLRSLKPLRRLKELGLSRTNVGDDGMSVVAGLDKLEYLDLYMTKVDEPGLTKLGSLTNLRQLTTSVSYEKTARLRSRLPKLSMWGMQL
jgi:hypothetical protein